MVVKSEGRDRFIRARRGVVLATGGFENNPRMYENYAYVYNAFPKGAHFNTGDGIEMALDVNAKLVNMAVVNGPDPNVINPDTGAAYGYLLHDTSHNISGCGFTRNNAVIVGADGWRFMNEALQARPRALPQRLDSACHARQCLHDLRRRSPKIRMHLRILEQRFRKRNCFRDGEERQYD